MGVDRIIITILEDGTIRSETDRVSGLNHESAESFLRGITRATGGDVSRVRKGTGHVHGHNHDHNHDHNHGVA